MTYDFQDILSITLNQKEALTKRLVEEGLAYEDSCGNVVLCHGTRKLLEKDPDFINRFLEDKPQERECIRVEHCQAQLSDIIRAHPNANITIENVTINNFNGNVGQVFN